jgi:hypothetical protein
MTTSNADPVDILRGFKTFKQIGDGLNPPRSVDTVKRLVTRLNVPIVRIGQTPLVDIVLFESRLRGEPDRRPRGRPRVLVHSSSAA